MTGYQSKKAAAQAIDKVNWADHEPDGLEQPEQEPVACKPLCELCVKRGYTFCANAVKTTPIPTPPQRTEQPTPVQEPVNLLEARKIAAEYGTPNSQVDEGNLYFALIQCLEHIDAQPEQKPVAWLTGCPSCGMDSCDCDDGTWNPPPQRPWVDLTNEEIDAIYLQHHNQYNECESLNWGYERDIEAKLKEKNT